MRWPPSGLTYPQDSQSSIIQPLPVQSNTYQRPNSEGDYYCDDSETHTDDSSFYMGERVRISSKSKVNFSKLTNEEKIGRMQNM